MSDLHELYREHTKGALAMIDPTASVHDTTNVWHFAVILGDVTIGHCCSIGSHTEIGRGTKVGCYTRIGSQCFLPPNSRIGNDVFIGPGVKCADDRHPYVHQPGDPPYAPEPPVIEDGVSIGLGAVLLPGVHIGKNAIVGAGAVVTKNVPADSAVWGIRASEHELSEAARTRFRRGVRGELEGSFEVPRSA